MRNLLQDTTHRVAEWLAWSPLLVLGLSVMTSVVLISACMSFLAPEPDYASPIPLASAKAAPAAPTALVASAR